MKNQFTVCKNCRGPLHAVRKDSGIFSSAFGCGTCQFFFGAFSSNTDISSVGCFPGCSDCRFISLADSPVRFFGREWLFPLEVRRFISLTDSVDWISKGVTPPNLVAVSLPRAGERTLHHFGRCKSPETGSAYLRVLKSLIYGTFRLRRQQNQSALCMVSRLLDGAALTWDSLAG